MERIIRENYKTFTKFLISGGISSLVSLIVLYVLTDIFGLWYLFSSFLGNTLGMCVNFYLQKNHTFEDKSNDATVKKFWLFAVNGLLDVVLNVIGMYLLVDILTLWHMLAQCIVMGVLAVKNFIVFKFVIFKQKE